MALPAEAQSKPRGPRPPLPEIPKLHLAPCVPNSTSLGSCLSSVASTPQMATLAIPHLNLSGRASNPDIGNVSLGSTLPSLGLPQLLDLSAFPPAASKKERHDVVICVPFTELSTDVQATQFRECATSVFGNVTVSDVPISCLVVEPEDIDTAIPTLQEIDAAFQDAEHLPFLIEQVEEQCVKLARQTEQNISEIEALKAEQQALMIEKAVLAERIRATKEDITQIMDVRAGLSLDIEKLSRKK